VTLALNDIAGRPLRTCQYGAEDAPPVLLIALTPAQKQAWQHSACALADAGRRGIVLALFEVKEPGLAVAALQAVLRQLPARPAIVAAGDGAALVLLALGEGEPDLASGFVALRSAHMVTGEVSAPLATLDEERLIAAARRLVLPALCIDYEGGAAACHAALVPDAETAQLRLTPEHADPQEAFDGLLTEFLERRVPRAPIDYRAGSDQRTLRDALGTFATGVTVVTATAPDGSHVGLTANSFTSVSLAPPLLLVCPARSSSSAPVLSQAEFFAVNVLHIGQQPVSTLFATRGVDRFANAEYEYWQRGVPILHNSLASFECRRHAAHDAGDHFILIGEVERARYAPQRDPLLYFRGKYRRLHFA
jgi:flavin reductase (DIM6/NTAB) family NADH-FMN oxidoreductase RutF